ncbi:carboxypeptidase M32 [Bdellovibrionota bacterium FG-1]
MPHPDYLQFISLVKEFKALGAAGAVLSWDQETYMPAKGAEIRADQLAVISGLAHEKLVSPQIGDLLIRLEKAPGLSQVEQVNIREIRRIFNRERKIPKELIQDFAKTQSLAHEAWASARTNNDFGTFAPWLEKLVNMRKKMAVLIGGNDPYDVLMDEFEPSARAADIQPIFEALRKELVPLVAKIAASSKKPSPLSGHYPVEKQRDFGIEVANAMGFDFDAGRLDLSAHPFCTSFGPNDVRITTRYNEKNFASALFGIMHEAGHGLYEQALETQHACTPLAEPVSMGIHESQSRLWENMIGRSRPFWNHFYPKLQANFPETLNQVPLETFFRSINIVRPSLIRVEADEVTYNLHILLRFELEHALFSGKASVNDLPELWNRKMEEYLGIRPKNDSEGVLQDIHWSMGSFGYFPTYALGNLYAAQFFAAAKREMPDLDQKIREGDLRPLREWLRDKIHRHGMTWHASELCQRATGETLNAQYFSTYLKSKFEELYEI